LKSSLKALILSLEHDRRVCKPPKSKQHLNKEEINERECLVSALA
jgi:hypothetical protein